MKKIFALVLACTLLLPLWGCKNKDEVTVYTEPEFTPGTLNSNLLTVEKGNLNRANQTGNGKFLENETGYYYYWWQCLCYAEKTDMDSWYYVCTNPNCTHSFDARSCGARSSTGNGLYLKDQRIYFTDDMERRYPSPIERGDRRGIALFSMEENGTNITLEFYSDAQQLANGGSAITDVFLGGYIQGGYSFNPDGTFTERFILVEEGWSERILCEKNVPEKPQYQVTTRTAQHAHRIYGDFSFVSGVVTDGMGYTEPLCWLNDGELMTIDIAQIPAKGGYLSGNILRGFAPNDGYYDTDLLTGQQTRLGDAQLADSGAMILQPNCIIETTLLNSEAAVQTQQMRFFDGQQWHDVKLPKELSSAPDSSFDVVALTSDSVIFSTKWQERESRIFGEDAITIFYRMSLDQTNYEVVYMGTYKMP